MAKERVHLIVSGRVQGVFFRSTSRTMALRLGLTGWTKNRMDGKVEIIAEGEGDKIGSFIQWCHEGPAGARVDKVDMEWEDHRGEFTTFSIRYVDRW